MVALAHLFATPASHELADMQVRTYSPSTDSGDLAAFGKSVGASTCAGRTSARSQTCAFVVAWSHPEPPHY